MTESVNSLFRVLVATALFYTIPVLFQHHRPRSLCALSGDRIASFPQCLQPTEAKTETKQPTGAPAAPTAPAGWDFGKCSPWGVFRNRILLSYNGLGCPGEHQVSKESWHIWKVHMTDWVNAGLCFPLVAGIAAVEMSGRVLSKIFFSLHGTEPCHNCT